jgi:DNA-binding protein YbaB
MAEAPYKEITSGDHKYQVYPLTGRAACHLDRKVTDLAYKFREVARDKNDMGMMILHAFAEMEDYEFDRIVEQTLVDVVRVGNGNEQDVKVKPDNVYEQFRGDLDGLYGLLIAVWEAYELTPFKKAKVVNTGA